MCGVLRYVRGRQHDPSCDDVAVGQALSGRRDVRLAILFGSQARGEAGPASDVDVAVQAPGVDLLALAATLSLAVGREVDVVALDAAGVPLLEFSLAPCLPSNWAICRDMPRPSSLSPKDLAVRSPLDRSDNAATGTKEILGVSVSPCRLVSGIAGTKFSPCERRAARPTGSVVFSGLRARGLPQRLVWAERAPTEDATSAGRR